VITAIKSSPSDEGIWTGPKVARWIEKEKGVEKVWNQRGWHWFSLIVILKSLQDKGLTENTKLEEFLPS